MAENVDYLGENDGDSNASVDQASCPPIIGTYPGLAALGGPCGASNAGDSVQQHVPSNVQPQIPDWARRDSQLGGAITDIDIMPDCMRACSLVTQHHRLAWQCGIDSGFADLADATSIVANCLSAIDSDMSVCLMDAKDIVDDVHNTILGSLQFDLDQASAIVDKIKRKIVGQLEYTCEIVAGIVGSIGSHGPATQPYQADDDTQYTASVGDDATTPIAAQSTPIQDTVSHATPTPQTPSNTIPTLPPDALDYLDRMMRVADGKPAVSTDITLPGGVTVPLDAVYQAIVQASRNADNVAATQAAVARTFHDPSRVNFAPPQYRNEVFPNWCSPTAVDDIKAFVGKFGGLKDQHLSRMFGLRDAQGQETNPQWAANASGWLPGPLKSAAAQLTRSLTDGIDLAIGSMPVKANCDKGTLAGLSTLKGVLDFVERWTGIDLISSRANLGYSINWLCPYLIATPAESVANYIMGSNDYATTINIGRANGVCEEDMARAINTAEQRLNPTEATAAMMRELISQEDWAKAMRRNGYLDAGTASIIASLNQYVPTMSDMIPWMVRDVFDPNVVRDYRLDDGFADKYQGDVVKWAKSQGVSENVFRYSWRSHWVLPSATQTYEMLHRLRPGHVAPNLVFTVDDARKLLEINDVAPAFQERFVAISYHPLTRTDAKRAYFIDAIGVGELKNAYLDLGYNDANADRLVAFTNKEKARYVRNQLGLPTPRTMINSYANDALTDDELREELDELGYDDTSIDTIVAKARLKRRIAFRGRIIKQTRKQVLDMAIDPMSAIEILTLAGLDAMQATALAEEWQALVGIRDKQIPAAKLCNWYGLGLLPKLEYIARLVRAGYDKSDAIRLAEECRIGKEEKERKQLETLEDQEQKVQASLEPPKKGKARRAASALAKIGKAAKRLEDTIARRDDVASNVDVSSQSY